MSDFFQYVEKVRDVGAPLTRAEANSAVRAMLAGEAGDEEIGALLTAIARRGETAEELSGFADALRQLAVPLPLADAERARLVDTCGTGGDGSGTFNISTAAALVAAAAGAKVAKHGNRAVTSKCGSADVLEALGVPVALPPHDAAECLRETGFAFLYAPLFNPSMKRVQGVRKALGFRTIFNLAGPLSNPANARAQIMGVFAADRVALVAQSMANLGVRRAFVVHGLDGLDELTVTGETMVAEVISEGAGCQAQGSGRWNQGSRESGEVRHFRFHPSDVGLALASLDQLRGGETAAENAHMLEAILSGEQGARRDVVLLNAAAALTVADVAADLREGLRRAAQAIDSGAAIKTLTALREFGARFAPERD